MYELIVLSNIFDQLQKLGAEIVIVTNKYSKFRLEDYL